MQPAFSHHLIAGVLIGALLAGCAATPGSSRGLEREPPNAASENPVPVADGTAQHALVIGNSRYQYSPLRNPGNDARDMARVLRERGFEVAHHSDLDSAGLQRAVHAFAERLRRRPGAGVVFFAGHGVEVAGRNYLIPIDNDRIRDESDVRERALGVDYLLERVRRAGNPLNIVILDACRDDPFRNARSGLSGTATGRSGAAPATRGHTGADRVSGTLIAYATAPGRTADDNIRGNNGLYTAHLIRAIRSGQRVEDMFQQVRRDVLAASNGQQEPWTHMSLDGLYCFGDCAPVPSAAASDESALERRREQARELDAQIERRREQVERLAAENARREREAQRLAEERARREREASAAPSPPAPDMQAIADNQRAIRDRLREINEQLRRN